MYNAERGFGFIKSETNGESYFVHVSQIHDGILERGYLVEFSVGINKKTGKEQAEKVMVIEEPVKEKKKRHRKKNSIGY